MLPTFHDGRCSSNLGRAMHLLQKSVNVARRVTSRGLGRWFVSGLALTIIASAFAPHVGAQTRTATVTQWDIFASTGGADSSLEARANASKNISSIVLDRAGVAGPADSVW